MHCRVSDALYSGSFIMVTALMLLSLSLVFPFPFTDTVLCPLRSVLRLLLLLKALGFTGLLAFGLLFGLLFSISNIFVVEIFKFVCSTLTGDESC